MQKLIYLKTRIPKQNITNYLRLQALLCWNYDAGDEKQRSLAIAFANEQIDKPYTQQSQESLLDIKLCRAWFNELNGQAPLALDEYNEVIQQAYQIESFKLIADARSIRGAMHSFQGNFSMALEDLITAQHLYDNLGLNHWSQVNLSDLATSYRRFGDPQTAIKYYKQLEMEYLKLNDHDSAIGMATEMAIAYEELGEYEQAIEYYNQAYEYWINQGDSFGAATIAVNISGSLLKLDRISEANAYLALAKASITPSDEIFYSFMKLFEAKIHLTNNEANEALVDLSEASEAFKRVQNKRGLAELSLLESQVYTTLNDWPKAFQSLERYLQLHNELDAKMQSTRTAEMRARFNTEQIEIENKQLIELQRAKDHEVQILKQNKHLQYAVLILVVIMLLFISFLAIKQAEKSKLLTILALTDHLTKLANRRRTYAEAERIFSDKSMNLALILFDADDFKNINDKFGHDIGDKVLVELANASNLMMRRSDLVGRVGGEEFLILLPNTTLDQAMKIANRFVESISKTDLSSYSEELTISISAGVAAKEQDKTFSELLQRADIALYEAKIAGKNRANSHTQLSGITA
ncbi:diguanylate cyclase [Shewanella sp. D64]|uniref:tetratricopeptide repeat-containing diguanylate cyclase n=1 Tax=unclassified Shewanella TaxID=196818 RepID=UPI0022BA37BB|nr:MULTISPECIES: tetratricopeptide repeat-containing diguanylate cyclase [unclassified Shewanella]MEC4725174.1 diguanylate cyclase [Shewanella sp. D64]MEC4737075.1 diguanylate cyclase [Shewanella sp. E94]WBJ96660.1 diguanylate cyclase [Shewanella sp. MTB7]